MQIKNIKHVNFFLQEMKKSKEYQNKKIKTCSNIKEFIEKYDVSFEQDIA